MSRTIFIYFVTIFKQQNARVENKSLVFRNHPKFAFDCGS
jgi:hypothetical protein